ncbi:hypothetical protein QJS04_geneDACA013089 [Acorus gramineus]|uniref:Uncharacterized protein n=1 Tax=Acorus gramineus TaxID=55184 RepID=A0AAV9B6C4_ACOGR|nr:hypothetical protein QJS04_geneDACA013089 [Acorus gramineus]
MTDPTMGESEALVIPTEPTREQNATWTLASLLLGISVPTSERKLLCGFGFTGLAEYLLFLFLIS